LKRDMDLIAQIGGTRIAASPAGAHGKAITDLSAVARRYRKVLELGEQTGVVPQLEIWGSSKTLSRLGEAIFVAVEAAHPDACLLLDAYHLYKGGSDFGGLRLLNGAAMHVFHVNDYPADPPRETINDSHRVFPGDGVAPLGLLLRTLYASGYRGMLSLELFNRKYWKQDALSIAKTGLEKTRAVVRKAFLLASPGRQPGVELESAPTSYRAILTNPRSAPVVLLASPGRKPEVMRNPGLTPGARPASPLDKKPQNR